MEERSLKFNVKFPCFCFADKYLMKEVPLMFMQSVSKIFAPHSFFCEILNKCLLFLYII